MLLRPSRCARGRNRTGVSASWGVLSYLLSYPSKSRFARRVRVAMFSSYQHAPSCADSPRTCSGFLNRVCQFSYRGSPLRAEIVCPGQHDRYQDQTGLTWLAVLSGSGLPPTLSSHQDSRLACSVVSVRHLSTSRANPAHVRCHDCIHRHPCRVCTDARHRLW